MGVIYKILKQQRQQQQQQQQQQQHQHQRHQQIIKVELNTATKCKVQAAIKQRQLQRLEEQRQEQRVQQEHDDALAEQQLQQLCRFLAENAARKKRQCLKLQYDYNQGAYAEQPATHSPATTHDMDLLMEQLSTCSEDAGKATATATATATAKVPSDEPRVSILLKIRHQIFERKRQRQRQLAELVKQRLVVWRPW
ncbi:mediator of RNA polymerase II transcription subunit 15 [Drosophila virilis]|uniref:mediator of RNA polymerase II transcription subunit 15 n=1 Tax=Drosophila virilis TaxID=7244 RepID=UPI00017D507C|nr:putative cyclin-dependent serine/threonine-protein kinase DDB_G0272797/DDB_G0274007 [Drosophila virilis]